MIRRLALVTIALMGGCSVLFSPPSSHDDGSGVDAATGFPTSNRVVLPEAGEALSIANGETLYIRTEDPVAVMRESGDGVPEIESLSFKRLTTSAGELVVLELGSLHIDTGGVLRGIGPRPLAIAIADSAQINGMIDLSSNENEIGAGGYRGGLPAQDGATCDSCCPAIDSCEAATSGGGNLVIGAAGASFGGLGGAGRISEAGSNPPGSTYGTLDLQPLAGGAGGAGSASAEGGGGGGALQISAANAIVIEGTIHAGGGGGGGGLWQSGGWTSHSGGAGGGAGGAILLEAPTVDLTSSGIIAVHGGAGGSANAAYMSAAGVRGLPGPASAEGAPKTVNGEYGGAGGQGSDSMGNGGAGDLAGIGTNSNGGGGGGGGRIRINCSLCAPDGITTGLFPPPMASVEQLP